VRIDSIEQAVRDSEVLSRPVNDVEYRVGYAVAEDNLRVGRTVIADSVNPIQLTSDAWVATSKRAQVVAIEIEVVCSDIDEHRRRAEGRVVDIQSARLPTWREVLDRDYGRWHRDRILIDTARRSVEQNVKTIREMLAVLPHGDSSTILSGG
jgi:predicted kinase